MKKLSKNEWIAVAVGVFVVVLVILIPRVAGFSHPAPAVSQPQNMNAVQTSDAVAGTGAEAKLGSTVAVHYTGMFTDGTVFDSSVGSDPLEFVAGAPGLIEGFTQGVLGMKQGGKRRVVIPPALGYGPNDYGPIPGNSTLVFDLELVSVK